MRYIKGEDRDQAILFPEKINDYIEQNNPVRFIDAFVDSLDMSEMAFTHSQPKKTGRKPYNPADLLKLYIYGYMNKVRSSRELEKVCHRNVEVIWLLRKLAPDFKTIADFRKDNGKAIKKVCREFILECKTMNLLSSSLVGIDGSKFRAVNANKKNYSKSKLKKLIEKIDRQIQEYLKAVKEQDEEEVDVKELSKAELQEKIAQLKAKSDRYDKMIKKMDENGQTQISLTDPDSRMMKNQQNREVCYNSQIAVDDKYKLIVAHEVCNDINDYKQLYNMSSKAKESLGVESIRVLADKGYFKKEEVKRCYDDNIDCCVPEQRKSQNRRRGLYTDKDFFYDVSEDAYICPAGKKLKYKYTVTKYNKRQRVYQTKLCKGCKLRRRCTTAKYGRSVYRWESKRVIEEMNKKIQSNPGIINKRKGLVEHPFGALKRTMNHGYFLTKGLAKVNTEFDLSVLAYNVKRVINIMGYKGLVAALAQKSSFYLNICLSKTKIRRLIAHIEKFWRIISSKPNFCCNF